MTSKTVKNTSLAFLKDRWAFGIAVGLVLLMTFVFGFITFGFLSRISYLLSCLFLFAFTVTVFSPLIAGTVKVFWKLYSSDEADIGYVFFYFSAKDEYLKCLCFSFMKFCYIFFAAFILLIPSLSVKILYDGTVFELLGLDIPLWTTSLSFIYVFFKIVAVILTVFYSVRFIFSDFLFVTNNERGAKECISLSFFLIKKYFQETTECIVSFAGWILLSFLFVPLMFIYPYLCLSYVVKCKSIADSCNGIKFSAEMGGI